MRATLGSEEQTCCPRKPPPLGTPSSPSPAPSQARISAMRCAGICARAGVEGGRGAHEATAGVSLPRSEDPITEGSGMKSWSEDHLARRAPRGPSSSNPREPARGWGRGSGQNWGQAGTGKPGVPWPPPPTGAPLNGRRRGAGKRSQADSHPTLLAEPPHPLAPTQRHTPERVLHPGTWSPLGTAPRLQPRASRPRRLHRPAAGSAGLTFV